MSEREELAKEFIEMQLRCFDNGGIRIDVIIKNAFELADAFLKARNS